MFNIINRAIVEVSAFKATRQEGQAMVEYGLLAGLVSILAIAGLTLTGQRVQDIFNDIAAALPPVD